MAALLFKNQREEALKTRARLFLFLALLASACASHKVIAFNKYKRPTSVSLCENIFLTFFKTHKGVKISVENLSSKNRFLIIFWDKSKKEPLTIYSPKEGFDSEPLMPFGHLISIRVFKEIDPSDSKYDLCCERLLEFAK